MARFGKPITPADLKDHRCLIRSDARTWTSRGPDGHVEEVRVSAHFATNLAEAVTEAVLAGVGIARKCRWEIEEYLETGELIALMPAHTVLPEWSVYAVRPPARTPPARVRAFIDFVAERLQGEPSLMGR